MKSRTTILAVALTMLLPCAVFAQDTDAADASFARTLPVNAPVRVEWTDPEGFSEIRYSRNRFESRRGNWVQRLAEHLQQQAARAIGPDERLELLITDIELAGDYEPLGTGLDDVRVVRDVYPPRMRVDYVRHGADGQVMQQGSRTLSDPGFLGATSLSAHDPLRFEKRMIDAWVRREFASSPPSHGQR